MKNILFLTIIIATTFWQCTPKKITDPLKPELIKVEDFRSSAPAPGPAPKIQMGTYESFNLENGLKVITVENHKIPRVSFQLFIDIPVIEEGDQAGFVSTAGELLGRGTSTRTKAELDEAIDFIGANLSSSASGIYASSLKKHTDELLELMADVLMNPSFKQEEFDKIIKQSLSGLESSKDDPNAIAGNVAQRLRYGDHPYGEITTEETLKNIKLESAKAFYDKYFNPENAYLVVVGDVTPDEAKTYSDKFFSKWKKGKMLNKPSFEMPSSPSQTTVDFVNKTGAVQSVINVTYPIDMKPGSEDAIKARVMNTMLGGFFRSYLNANLREDKAYTYGARSSLSGDKEIGYFTAGASVRNEVTDSSIVQFLHELNRIRNEKVSPEDLSLVKNVMSGNFASSLESPQTVARFALNTSRYNLPSDYYETYLERLNAVTAEDVMAMAKKYIRPDNAHILVVGNKDEVADKLGQFGPMVFRDIYGEEVKMNDIVLPDDFTGEKLIEDYMNALGGANKIAEVKDMTTIMTTEMQGMALTSTVVQKAPNKFLNEVSVANMGIVQKQVFDGTNGSATEMGQASQKIEGKALEALKDQATMFAEKDYVKNGYTLELKGIEPVEGKDAYKLIVTAPDGSKTTEFYDTSNSLKIQTIQTIEAQGQTITQTSSYADYKEVDGIMCPHKISTNMGPMVLKFDVKEIKINTGVEDSVFKVD